MKENMLDILSQEYPSPQSELNFTNNYQLLISVVLSAQCTDKKVNQVTPELFNKFPGFRELSKARLSTVEKIIRPINYYKTKSKNIIAASRIIAEELGGKIPEKHDEIINLPGVGRKTANVVLGEMGVEKTMPVDTHVMRVSRRLGLTSSIKPDKVEEELKVQFEPSLWRNLHHWLILHGRRVCKAQNPNCPDCKLNHLCPSALTARTSKAQT